MIVTDERVARYVSEKLNCSICPPFTAMGIERNGKIVAGTIFSQFEHPDIHVTVAGEPGAFTHNYIRAIGEYVFGMNGCIRMTIVTEQPKVIEIATRLNAQPEGRIRNHFGVGRDGILLGILKDEWPFKYEDSRTSRAS